MWRIVIGSLVVAVSGCAQSVSSVPLSEVTASKGEIMLFSTPTGFRNDFYSGGGESGVVIVPEGQSLWGGWTELIYMKTNLRSSAPSAEQFAMEITSGRNCTDKIFAPIVTSMANGHPAATLKMTCTLSGGGGKTETTLTKAVRGTRGAYAAQYVVRAPVDDQKLGTMTQFVDSLTICDPQSQEHPCANLKRP